MSDAKIGDYVRCYIPGPDAPADRLYVIGFMDYGSGRTDIALVGNERAHGMPVNIAHLTVLSSGHDVTAWSDRYAALYPGATVTNPIPPPPENAPRTDRDTDSPPPSSDNPPL